jgi:GntR family transcriptional regulator, trigonelline degradation regulator
MMTTDLLDEMRIISDPSPTRRLVKERITDAIVQGRFKPGERLIERELCALMGVSRTPLREALRELESEGLIDNLPNKGPIVATISIVQAENIYAVRAVLEGLAAKQFTERATKEQIQRLDNAVERIGKVYADFSPERFLDAKVQFYECLFEGAANDVAQQALRALHVRISQLRVYSLSKPQRSANSLTELRTLIARIREGNALGAQAQCVEHVQNAAYAALSVMSSLAPAD